MTSPAVSATHLRPEQVSDLAPVLSRAFFDDPLTVYVEPDEGARMPGLLASFTAIAGVGLATGEVFTTEGHVDGGAIWIAPGRKHESDEHLGEAMPQMAAAFSEEAMQRFGYAFGILDELHARDMSADHWYLFVLGVDTPMQGRGIGSQLMRPILERADASGLPCYLETAKARNVVLYERHGFEVVVNDRIPGEGGFEYWTMIRQPR